MDDFEMAQLVDEALGVPTYVMQFLALQAGYHCREVDYAFDAAHFFGQHVGLAYGEKIPEDDDAVGAVVRSAVAATNAIAGGGAAGYLAVIELLMVSFREDFRYADEMVQRYVLRQRDGE
jgi:hypothetical protein